MPSKAISASFYLQSLYFQILLNWKDAAPRADIDDGQALVEAAGGGHAKMVQMLLRRRRNAPRANCQDGEALVAAAGFGHVAVVDALLGAGKHAPRADCQHGQALIEAAGEGHIHVVERLLKHTKSAPRADCQVQIVAWVCYRITNSICKFISDVCIGALLLLGWRGFDCCSRVWSH